MTDTPDNTSKAKSPDAALKKFAATLVGFIAGQFIGDNSIILAKLILYISHEGTYERWKIYEIALPSILLFSCLGFWFGALMARRGWVDDIQIVLAAVATLSVALFTTINQALPDPTDSSSKPFWETAYFIGWFFALFLAPVLFVPNSRGNTARRIRYGSIIIAVSAVMVFFCLLSGYALVKIFGNLDLWFDIMKGEPAILENQQKFWLAIPSAVNTIMGPLFAVAFMPLWWPRLWNGQQFGMRLWMTGFFAFAFVYGTLYGKLIYVDRKPWLSGLEASCSTCAWTYSLAIGSFSLVLAAVGLILYRFTKNTHKGNLYWPTSKAYWWILPPGLAIGFSMIVLIGFRPVLFAAGATWNQIAGLTAAHAINGVVLGLTLRVLVLALKRVRANVRP